MNDWNVCGYWFFFALNDGKKILIKTETETTNNGTKNAALGWSDTTNLTTEYPNPKDGKRIIKKMAVIFIFAGIAMADFILFDFFDYGS